METYFPDELDGAKVLCFTKEDNYGAAYVVFGNGEEDRIHYKYLAICRYNEDNRYYLFLCDNEKRVVRDTLWDSVDECKAYANQAFCQGIDWIAK